MIRDQDDHSMSAEAQHLYGMEESMPISIPLSAKASSSGGSSSSSSLLSHAIRQSGSLLSQIASSYASTPPTPTTVTKCDQCVEMRAELKQYVAYQEAMHEHTMETMQRHHEQQLAELNSLKHRVETAVVELKSVQERVETAVAELKTLVVDRNEREMNNAIRRKVPFPFVPQRKDLYGQK